MQLSKRIRFPLYRSKQGGFSLIAAFIVIAILMAVVAYFIAGQGMNTSQTSTYSNSARASAVITQGAYLQGGVNVMVSAGSSLSTLTFDSNATGLFNPSSGGVQPQLPDPNSFQSTTAPDAFWIYRGGGSTGGIKILGVGSVTTPNYGVVLSGLKQAVCAQIDQQLHNTSSIPVVVPAITAIRAGSTTAAAPTDTSTVLDLTGTASLSGWDKGCGKSSDGVYFYWQVLAIQ